MNDIVMIGIVSSIEEFKRSPILILRGRTCPIIFGGFAPNGGQRSRFIDERIVNSSIAQLL